MEVSTDGIYRGNVKIFTLMPETDEKVLFTDCADVPFEIKIADEEAFELESRSGIWPPISGIFGPCRGKIIHCGP